MCRKFTTHHPSADPFLLLLASDAIKLTTFHIRKPWAITGELALPILLPQLDAKDPVQDPDKAGHRKQEQHPHLREVHGGSFLYD